jgi:prephenate dehydratase
LRGFSPIEGRLTAPIQRAKQPADKTVTGASAEGVREMAKALKASNVIAFQGEPGANSDMACRAAFPYMTTLPCPTFEAAMGAVQAGKAELAIIPVENSIAGRVADLHSLLPHTKLKIVAEHFQRVEHCLVALPGATLKSIKTVKSHVQALSQCRNFLKKHRFAPLVHADTAGAIASSLAARIYDLKVLAKNIEDADHNTTRMLVFSRHEATPDWRTVQCMTAFLFRVKSVPAALYKALGGFATNSVNIVKLESYLSGARFEQAEFYAEVEGHPQQRGLQLALEELGFFSEQFKPLGSFPVNPFRRKGWEAPTRPGT